MKRVRIGFIPLCDAVALIVAADKGFLQAEGLDIELVREVSWSNIRDKLNIGLFDAAHLIAPIAIASSLGLGHVKVPIVAPFALGLNGNAITVSPALYASIAASADGNIIDPMVSARALAKVVAELAPFYGDDCPVAVVAEASRPGEKIVRGTLGDIVAKIDAAPIERTALILVGRALAAEEFRDSALYDADYRRRFRGGAS